MTAAIIVVWVVVVLSVAYAQTGNHRTYLLNRFPKWQQSDTANPTFVAFMAHAGWGALAVLVANHFGYYWPGVLLGMALAVGKEFFYDFVFELPQQTNRDNLQDVLGYAAAIPLSLLLIWLGLVS